MITGYKQLAEFTKKALRGVAWLGGRLSGFTVDEVRDLTNDLKTDFEASPFFDGTLEDYDEWYDNFAADHLVPLLLVL